MTPRPYTITDWQARAIAEDRLGLIVMPLRPQPNRLNGGKPLNNGHGSYSTENCWKVFPFAPDDLLWCRETWWHGEYNFTPDDVESSPPESTFFYKADNERRVSWRSPVTMPKWASRTTLRVLNVDVKRVRDITEEEAKLAGATSRPNCCGCLKNEDGWSVDWTRVGQMSQWAMKPPGSPRYTPLKESDIALNDAQMAIANALDEVWNANPWCAFGRVKVIKKKGEYV